MASDRDGGWWRPFRHLRNYGYGVTAADRVRDAEYAARDANGNAPRTSGEAESLAVRIAADTFASQILAHAPDYADRTTVAWVVAGLRCPAAPFCEGCPSCQSVTAPLRPNREPVRTW